MAKFCGNCGTQLDDSANVCGNCGTPVEAGKVNNASIPGISYMDPEKKAKIVKNAKLAMVIAIVVIVATIAFNIVSGFVGYKGVARKVMKAYKNYDIETLVSMASEYYYFYDNEDYVEEYFEDAVADDLDFFEDQMERKYRLSYKILDGYEMSEHKFDDLMDTLSYNSDFDADTIKKVMIVKVDVTAKAGKDTMTTPITLTLTKENGSWKILYLY